jgi:excisionase family DNA binding protein
LGADEKLLTPDEVAERLQLSPFTVANMLRAGTLPGMKVGHLWRIRAADLDAFIIEKSEVAAAKRAARATVRTSTDGMS